MYLRFTTSDYLCYIFKRIVNCAELEYVGKSYHAHLLNNKYDHVYMSKFPHSPVHLWHQAMDSLKWVLWPFHHRVVCSSLIYGFWLPLWYLQTRLVNSVTCRHCGFQSLFSDQYSSALALWDIYLRNGMSLKCENYFL